MVFNKDVFELFREAVILKIAILVPNFSDYSGDARVAAIQAEDLSKKGNDVSIFAFAGNIKHSSANINFIGMCS